MKKNGSFLRLWRLKKSIIEGKVAVFKSLAIFNTLHLSLVTMVPHTIINQLNNIQKKTLYETEKIQKYNMLIQLQRQWFERR